MFVRNLIYSFPFNIASILSWVFFKIIIYQCFTRVTHSAKGELYSTWLIGLDYNMPDSDEYQDILFGWNFGTCECTIDKICFPGYVRDCLWEKIKRNSFYYRESLFFHIIFFFSPFFFQNAQRLCKDTIHLCPGKANDDAIDNEIRDDILGLTY